MLVSNPAGVPDTFDLVIELNGLREPCRVIWKDERRIGVSFTETDRNRDDELGHHRTIRGSTVVRDLLTFKWRHGSLGRHLRSVARRFR